MPSNPLNSQFGKFAPDSMLITMYPQHALIGPGGTSGTLKLRGASYLFHEWMHYLHNVSTLHGAACFVSLVEYWNIFRFTIKDRTESLGSRVLSDEYQAQVERAHQILTGARAKPREEDERTLPSKARLKRCRVISVYQEPIGEDGIEAPASLAVEVRRRRSRASRRTKTYELLFSATDLLESLAYMLEARFLWRLNRKRPIRVAVDPYQTLFLIARHLAPRLTKKEVLMCGLASLQTTVPVKQVVEFLKQCNDWKLEGKNAKDLLAAVVKKHLLDIHADVERWFVGTEQKFPVDNPIARAIHEVLKYLRSNLDHRRRDPFFELDIIEQLRASGAAGFGISISRLMAQHGMCSIEQVQRGPDEQVGRDVHGDFAVMAQDAITSEGRRVMFASFTFALDHLSPDGRINPTLAIRGAKCPFYTSCTAPERRTHISSCKRTPWDSLKWAPGTECWYRAGAHQTRMFDA